jgi:hypothetical protein
MINIAVWLFGIIIPLAKKLLAGLGIGLVSYAALSLVFAQVQTAVISAYGAMGQATLQILALGGVTQAVGIILGAFTARLTFIAVGKFGRVSS